MFEEVTFHTFFPTVVWVLDLKPEIHQPLNRDLKAYLEETILPRPETGPGATLQTETDLHMVDEMAALSGHITAAATGALDFLKIDYDHYEITGCWANFNPRGGLNTPHTHPNNFLGGVYYVQIPEGADEIVFTDPRPQASMISPPVKEETIYTGNEVAVDAKEGRMVLFPAWLAHGVPVNRSDRDRISIAFNIMFSSFTETMSKTKWKGNVPSRPAGRPIDDRADST